ncbi:hypothetical protein NL676_030073 [Syzygium grande]|nr:hypothetical protein NL676_030073 [Syzygium grande]
MFRSALAAAEPPLADLPWPIRPHHRPQPPASRPPKVAQPLTAWTPTPLFGCCCWATCSSLCPAPFVSPF